MKLLSVWIIAAIVRVVLRLISLILLIAVFLEFLQLVCVGSPDELAIHVKDLALWVHEELSIVALDLYPPHYHVVLHVDAHLLVILGRLHFSVRILIVLIWVCVFELLLILILTGMVIFDVHCLGLGAHGWLAALSAVPARVALRVHLILILVVEFQRVVLAVRRLLIGIFHVIGLL